MNLNSILRNSETAHQLALKLSRLPSDGEHDVHLKSGNKTFVVKATPLVVFDGIRLVRNLHTQRSLDGC